MFITPPSLAEVTGHAADMYASDMSDDGFVHTYTQAMAINPEAHQAFEALIRAIVPSIGIGNYEAATLGAARAIGSTHCLLAHGRLARTDGSARRYARPRPRRRGGVARAQPKLTGGMALRRSSEKNVRGVRAPFAGCMKRGTGVHQMRHLGRFGHIDSASAYTEGQGS